MKTPLILSLFLGLMLSFNGLRAQQRSIADLTGRWESPDGTTGSIEFIDGGRVIVSISGLQVPATNYVIDFSKDPIWFDVYVTQNRTVKGLLQFVDDNTIKWQVFPDTDRPNDFTDSSTPAITLKRKT